MALVLDATVGGANSNAYLDQAAAQAYIDGTPNASAWTTADGGIVVAGGQRDQALVYATTLLEAIPWKGVKIGTATTQALCWPRNFVQDPDAGTPENPWFGWSGVTIYLDGTTIPRRILRATTALALEILRAGTDDVAGVDPNINVKVAKTGPLDTEFVEPYLQRRNLQYYPTVWREIWPLTKASAQARVERT